MCTCKQWFTQLILFFFFFCSIGLPRGSAGGRYRNAESVLSQARRTWTTSALRLCSISWPSMLWIRIPTASSPLSPATPPGRRPTMYTPPGCPPGRLSPPPVPPVPIPISPTESPNPPVTPVGALASRTDTVPGCDPGGVGVAGAAIAVAGATPKGGAWQTIWICCAALRIAIASALQADSLDHDHIHRQQQQQQQ